jgi:hypothetical protein
VRRAALAAAALLVAGCQTLAPPAVPLAPGDPRPAALLAGLEGRSAELAALRGVARLAVDGPAGSLRSRQVLVAARPARLRVEVLGFLSQTEALLVSDGETYALFEARGRRFEEALVRPGILEEIAGIDLEPREAVEVLLGAPDLAGLAPEEPALAAHDGAVRISLADPAGRRRRGVEFDASGALRRVVAWDEDGTLAWVARYDGVEPVAGIAFAHGIDLEFPHKSVHARLELSRVDLNPELEAEVFRIELPPPAQEGGS